MSKLVSDEEISQAFASGKNGDAAEAALRRFMVTTPNFYPSEDNLTELLVGVSRTKTAEEYTDVQSFRDVYEMLKTEEALESAPAPVEAKTPDAVDADGFTEQDRQRAKARLAVKQERALWNMPADEYLKQTGLTRGKHAR